MYDVGSNKCGESWAAKIQIDILIWYSLPYQRFRDARIGSKQQDAWEEALIYVRETPADT